MITTKVHSIVIRNINIQYNAHLAKFQLASREMHFSFLFGETAQKSNTLHLNELPSFHFIFTPFKKLYRIEVTKRMHFQTFPVFTLIARKDYYNENK